MAELADALDLGSSVARREGSSPFSPICASAQQDPTGHFRGLDPHALVYATIGATGVALSRTISSVGRATDF